MNQLKNIIKDKIVESGPMCFADFMELALYHPEYGYYTSKSHKIGKAGDFFTAPHTTSLFGRTIGKAIQKYFGDKPVKIIEFGAGHGWLAKDITDYLEEQNILYEYFIIELSASMIERQKRLLAGKSKIKWLSDLHNVAKDDFFILANELLDAMPVHRVIKSGSDIDEIKVGLKDGTFRDIHTKPCPEVVSFIEQNPDFKNSVIEGEINTGSIKWLEDVIVKLTGGSILIIDYGYTNKELSHYPNGTVNCFFEHVSTGDPYINIGSQDITAYVNFDPLIKVAERRDYSRGILSQSAFLIENGIFDEQQKLMKTMDEINKFKLSMSIKTLIMPNAMGERFKCLSIWR